jgi:hypothetical protein
MNEIATRNKCRAPFTETEHATDTSELPRADAWDWRSRANYRTNTHLGTGPATVLYSPADTKQNERSGGLDSSAGP